MSRKNRIAWSAAALLLVAMLASAPGQSQVQPQPMCPMDPPDPSAALPDAQWLSDFNQWMACLGPRLTGTDAHNELLDQIEDSMEDLVQTGKASLQVVPRKFVNWEAQWPASLTLDPNPAIPVAGYMPFSGLTPANGVYAEVVYQRPGFLRRRVKFRKEKHEGKIVAVPLRSSAVPRCILRYLARTDRSDFSNWEPYRRATLLELAAPCLDQAREAGVEGVIGILDMSVEHAKGHYLPFAREPDRPIGEGVPGIYVDRIWKRRLKKHGAKGQKARLVLEGDVDCCDKTRHLIYTLPGKNGGESHEEFILVQTHTDGPSALEENGVIALIALAHHFAAIPASQRERTLVFLFATGHHVHQIQGATDVIWENPPAWLAATRAAVAIEHLGAMEWIDSETGYRGRTKNGVPLAEPSLLLVTTGGDNLEDRAHDHLSKARRILIPARKRVKKLFKRDFFGEGQYVSCTGVPTVGYVPNPNYLVSWADPGGPHLRGHFEKLDPNRMSTELTEFRNLIRDLINADLSGWPKVKPDVRLCVQPKDPCE